MSDEVGAIADLLNDHARTQHGEPVTSAAQIAHWLRLPNLEPWVAEDARGRLAAYADVREEAERKRYWPDVREHPERRGLGAAGALLGAAEEWARGRAAAGKP